MNKMRSYPRFIANFIERKLVRYNFGRSAMKIHFLTSAHNSLSQRLLVELTQRGHKVTVAIASSEEAMVKSVEDQAPDLIIAPMLTLGDRDGRADMGRVNLASGGGNGRRPHLGHTQFLSRQLTSFQKQPIPP
jgi:hypothetical protein